MNGRFGFFVGFRRRALELTAVLLLAVVIAPSCSQPQAVLPEDVPDDFTVEYSFKGGKVTAKAVLQPAALVGGEIAFELTGIKEKTRGIFGDREFKVMLAKSDILDLYDKIRRNFFSLHDKYQGFGQEGAGTVMITVVADGNVKTVELVDISLKPVEEIVSEMNRLIKEGGEKLEMNGLPF
jgi:hypothetical protein